MGHPRHAKAFEWDEGNEGHLAESRISPTEVEEVFYSGAVWARNKIGMSGDWVLYGQTGAGRALILIAVYDEERLVLRVFTGWDCDRGERTRYIR